MRIALALLLIALGGSSFAATVWMAEWSGGIGLLELWFDSSPILKLVDVMLVFVMAGVVVVGITTSREGPMPQPIAIMFALGPPILAALAAGSLALRSYQIAVRVHVEHWQVVGPSWTESLLTLTLGLTAGALGTIVSIAAARTRAE